MSLCKSIDTLLMAYLDDELAAEERHELETHLTECASCRAQLDQERADQAMVQRALVAPPTPDLLRARVLRALDAEDRSEQKTQRRRWVNYLLPGSAMVAAAAAMVMFLGVQSGSHRPSASINSAAKVTKRSLPLEVQGASTGPWLRANFAPMEPPQIAEGDAKLMGGRLLPGGIDGRDAAMIAYDVNVHGRPVLLTILVVRDLRDNEWNEGQAVRVNDRTMHVLQTEDGREMVSYVDSNHFGYLFLAPGLSTEDLVRLVGRTDLVGPQ